MRLFEIKPVDRKMTRREWRRLDQMTRLMGRKFAPEIDHALLSLAVMGTASYRISDNGEVRAISWEEMVLPDPVAPLPPPLPLALDELGFQPD